MLMMNDPCFDSPEAIRAFLSGASNLELSVSKSNRYEWLAMTLNQTGYNGLSKKDKGIVREYLLKVSRYSKAQLTRLIKQYKTVHQIVRRRVGKQTFAKRYSNDDILLLIKTDMAHQKLSGTGTKKLLERAYEVYKDEAYATISRISIAHIYNLRKSIFYQGQRRHFAKTKPTPVCIGERRKPQPNGKPGYIRIDTVHQGDQEKIKGVYHINAVDEVTQWQVVVSVEKISENHLIPVLEGLLGQFPFSIINFHSDNGSEYVNHTVARLLNKLQIEFTKSRAQHSNDNALAETKNGSVVRKYLGFVHIPQKYAPHINEFNRAYLTPYLNYHRPCHFAEIKTDKKGKQRKTYPYKNMMTPFEKFQSIENAVHYLRPGIIIDELVQQAMSMTDLKSAQLLRHAQKTLFATVFKKE